MPTKVRWFVFIRLEVTIVKKWSKGQPERDAGLTQGYLARTDEIKALASDSDEARRPGCKPFGMLLTLRLRSVTRLRQRGMKSATRSGVSSASRSQAFTTSSLGSSGLRTV